MADKKISALTATTTTATTDIAHVVTDMGSSPTNKKITVANLFNTIPTTIGYGTTAVSSAVADAGGEGQFEYDPSAGTFDGSSKDFRAICTKNIKAYGG